MSADDLPEAAQASGPPIPVPPEPDAPQAPPLPGGPVETPPAPLEAQVGPVIVLSHSLDPAAGLYRLVIGRKVTVPATEEADEIDLGVADEVDFVFDAGDKRWYTEDGQPRPEKDVAAEQKDLVREALAELQAQHDALDDDVHEMPGVGEEL